MWTALLTVLVFGFLILFHELGHYIAARIFGVKVYEFSIGMGPKLFWYDSKKTGTRYKVCMLPFGGYVSMGDGGDEAAESTDPRALVNQAPWKRLIIMTAGGFVNLLVGFLLMLSVVIATPMPSTVIHSFDAGAVSQETEVREGLRVNDRIIAVEGQRVQTMMELDYEIMRRGIEPMAVTVLRDGKEISMTLSFGTEEAEGQILGSRDFYVFAERKTVGNVLSESFFRCTCVVRMTWESLFDLITGRYGLNALQGPVGIAGSVGEAAGFGLPTLLYLVSFISINLGIVNLFPLPALDGGRTAFLLIEMIFRKPVPRKIEAIVHTVGILLLLGLSVVITVGDVAALLR